MEFYKEVERNIIKKYRKELYRPFVKALDKYELIKENDKIAVCISGGKDSFLMAKLFQEIMNHGNVKFECRFICMDPGYKEENRKLIEENAKKLNIPIEIFNSDIFEASERASRIGQGPCYLCARMRRGHLYNKAQELGCNKIALGHHFDDVIETTLLSMFYGSEIKTMMPKLHSDNFKGIDLIRPLYLVKEESIISWKNHNELTFINCACRFTEGCSLINDGTSKRKEIKELIKKLRKTNESIDQNIFNAMSNININCILGWHDDKEKHFFLDNY